MLVVHAKPLSWKKVHDAKWEALTDLFDYTILLEPQGVALYSRNKHLSQHGTLELAQTAAQIHAERLIKTASTAGVAPLQWEGVWGEPGHDIRATPTPNICYTVRHIGPDDFDVILDTDTGSKWFRNSQRHSSYEEAEAAAEADYQSRFPAQ